MKNTQLWALHKWGCEPLWTTAQQNTESELRFLDGIRCFLRCFWAGGKLTYLNSMILWVIWHRQDCTYDSLVCTQTISMPAIKFYTDVSREEGQLGRWAGTLVWTLLWLPLGEKLFSPFVFLRVRCEGKDYFPFFILYSTHLRMFSVATANNLSDSRETESETLQMTEKQYLCCVQLLIA